MPGAQIQIAPVMEDRSANQPFPLPYRTAPGGQLVGAKAFKQTASAVPMGFTMLVLAYVPYTSQVVSETTVKVLCALAGNGAASTAKLSTIATTTIRFIAFLLNYLFW